MRPSPAVSFTSPPRRRISSRYAPKHRSTELVDAAGIEPLREPRVPDQVDEQDGHVHLALVELWRLRRALDQVLHRAGHELGEVRPDALQDLDAADGRPQLRVRLLKRGIGLRVVERERARVRQEAKSPTSWLE
jgi:hypothetical protein